MITAVRSLADPDALSILIGERYGLVVDSCVLVRSFVNDVYRIGTSAGDLLLKVYGRAEAAEVEWEAQLTAWLFDHGIRVPPVLATRDHRLVTMIEYAERPRPAMITKFVRGEKPRPPFDGALYRRFGVAVAELHNAASEFTTDLPRRVDSLDRCLTEPYRRVINSGLLDPADRELVDRAAELAAARLEPLLAGLEQGVRHGDVTMDNLFLGGDRMIIYDLDLARPGWLIADLTGVASTSHWPDFLAGYRTVRSVDEDQLAALPWLKIAAVISNLDFHLIDKPAFLGTETLGEGWVARDLDALRESLGQLLP